MRDTRSAAHTRDTRHGARPKVQWKHVPPWNLYSYMPNPRTNPSCRKKVKEKVLYGGHRTRLLKKWPTETLTPFKVSINSTFEKYSTKTCLSAFETSLLNFGNHGFASSIFVEEPFTHFLVRAETCPPVKNAWRKFKLECLRSIVVFSVIELATRIQRYGSNVRGGSVMDPTAHSARCSSPWEKDPLPSDDRGHHSSSSVAGTLLL